MNGLKTWTALATMVLLLTLAAAAPADEAKPGGGCDLLAGGDLSAFQSASGGEPSAGWVLEDGALVRKQGAGYIWTKDRFDNFVLDVEFKTEGNSGIFIRTDNPKDPVQTGIEMQVDRPHGGTSRHSCGALYDLVAPTKEMCKDGEWNHAIITADGNLITVELNGQEIARMDLDQWTEGGKNPDGSKNKYHTALKDYKRDGHIGFQDHGATVAYRNIRVKRLGGK